MKSSNLFTLSKNFQIVPSLALIKGGSPSTIFSILLLPQKSRLRRRLRRHAALPWKRAYITARSRKRKPELYTFHSEDSVVLYSDTTPRVLRRSPPTNFPGKTESLTSSMPFKLVQSQIRNHRQVPQRHKLRLPRRDDLSRPRQTLESFNPLFSNFLLGNSLRPSSKAPAKLDFPARLRSPERG